jgi:chorismate mutase
VREQEILETIGQQSSPNLAEYVKDLYRAIFAISRDYQTKRNSEVAE